MHDYQPWKYHHAARVSHVYSTVPPSVVLRTQHTLSPLPLCFTSAAAAAPSAAAAGAVGRLRVSYAVNTVCFPNIVLIFSEIRHVFDLSLYSPKILFTPRPLVVCNMLFWSPHQRVVRSSDAFCCIRATGSTWLSIPGNPPPITGKMPGGRSSENPGAPVSSKCLEGSTFYSTHTAENGELICQPD